MENGGSHLRNLRDKMLNLYKCFLSIRRLKNIYLLFLYSSILCIATSSSNAVALEVSDFKQEVISNGTKRIFKIFISRICTRTVVYIMIISCRIHRWIQRLLHEKGEK